MLYAITEITEENIELFNEINQVKVTLLRREIDSFTHLEIGSLIEMNDDEAINNKVPYVISSRRRDDIRDYRADEARNGNI